MKVADIKVGESYRIEDRRKFRDLPKYMRDWRVHGPKVKVTVLYVLRGGVVRVTDGIDEWNERAYYVECHWSQQEENEAYMASAMAEHQEKWKAIESAAGELAMALCAILGVKLEVTHPAGTGLGISCEAPGVKVDTCGGEVRVQLEAATAVRLASIQRHAFQEGID